MKHGPRTWSSDRGFTLIELLVVISIIAMLISILLPALRTARDTAHSTGCLSNLRQIGFAFEMYANDYNRQIPAWQVWNNSPDVYGVSGHYNDRYERALDPYLGAQPSPETDNRAKANSPAWVCPLRLARGRENFAGTGPGGFRGSDYMTNRYMWWYTNSDRTRTDGRDSGTPSDRMVVGCGRGLELRATIGDWGRIYWQHSGNAATFLFLDWSARYQQEADTPLYRNQVTAQHPAGGGLIGRGYAAFWVWTETNTW